MNLFQINDDIKNVYDQIEIDEETGEIINTDVMDIINALNMKKEEIVENTALYIKNQNALIEALKAEKKAFDKRLKTIQARIDNSKRYISCALQGEKFESPRCSVSFRNSKSVNVFDEELLDDAYIVVKTERKPDKNLIKKAIEAGSDVQGAFIEVNQSVIIK